MENTMTKEMENVLLNEVAGPNDEVVVEVVKGTNYGKYALIAAGVAGTGVVLYKLGKKMYNKYRKGFKDTDVNITDLNKESTSEEDVQEAVIKEEGVDKTEKKSK